MERIKSVTGKRTRVELAGLLGIRRASIFIAKRCGITPLRSLLVLVHIRNVSPEWVLTGERPRLAPPLHCHYENGSEAAETDKEVIRRFCFHEC